MEMSSKSAEEGIDLVAPGREDMVQSMLEYAERQGWLQLTAEEQMSAQASRQKASCIGQGSEGGEEAQLVPPQCIKRCRQKRHVLVAAETPVLKVAPCGGRGEPKYGSNGHCKLMYTLNPVKVFAKSDLDDEKLVLVPQVDLAYIKVAKKEKANPAWVNTDNEVNVHGEKHGLYISKPPVPKADEVKELKPEFTFSFNPFFMVGTTHDKKANVTYYEEYHSDFKVAGDLRLEPIGENEADEPEAHEQADVKAADCELCSSKASCKEAENCCFINSGDVVISHPMSSTISYIQDVAKSGLISLLRSKL